MTVYCDYQSPIGPLLLVGDGEALSGLYMEGHRRGPGVGEGWRPDSHAFSRVTGQLDAYFAGERAEFDVPLAPQGTEFQLRVWQALRAIPYGETASYAQLAAAIGRPGAARAVGHANARNPISVIVPCHRAIGSGGALTGFAGGLERKRWLLEHEAGISRLAS